MDDLAKVIVAVGLAITLTGALLFVVGRVPGLGRLPGDLTFQSGGFTCFVPIATSIILSIVLTLVFNNGACKAERGRS